MPCQLLIQRRRLLQTMLCLISVVEEKTIALLTTARALQAPE